MRMSTILSLSLPAIVILLIFFLDMMDEVFAQQPDPLFELPVQLIGFPVIVLSVRLSQFAKKLAYSLNPGTYRAKRDISQIYLSQTAADAIVAEKEIMREFGPKACILEEPCRLHAARPGKRGAQPDWQEILRNYKVQSTGMKQWYLLSVFIGDYIRDVPLCKHLAKRLPCGTDEPEQFLPLQFTRD
ncbi:uncharacterized protein LOC129919482 [Episyrphus balteatus]|uniref:uncharacterized protein LOC129919482 n=1 Tax=Episyrphus balteatus TaxID=286459 RepID=UPI0024854E7D|nr:uncharacterized protein LOC129919482 [Episyrphus balteatus]